MNEFTNKFQVMCRRYLHSEQLHENGIIDEISVGQFDTFEQASDAARSLGGGWNDAIETVYSVRYPVGE